MTRGAPDDGRLSWGAERQISEWSALPFSYLTPWGTRVMGAQPHHSMGGSFSCLIVNLGTHISGDLVLDGSQERKDLDCKGPEGMCKLGPRTAYHLLYGRKWASGAGAERRPEND